MNTNIILRNVLIAWSDYRTKNRLNRTLMHRCRLYMLKSNAILLNSIFTSFKQYVLTDEILKTMKNLKLHFEYNKQHGIESYIHEKRCNRKRYELNDSITTTDTECRLTQAADFSLCTVNPEQILDHSVVSFSDYMTEPIETCKCTKQLGDDSVYGMIKQEIVFICAKCNKFDQTFTEYNLTVRNEYKLRKEADNELKAVTS